jgi:hypothetical protein
MEGPMNPSFVRGDTPGANLERAVEQLGDRVAHLAASELLPA